MARNETSRGTQRTGGTRAGGRRAAVAAAAGAGARRGKSAGTVRSGKVSPAAGPSTPAAPAPGPVAVVGVAASAGGLFAARRLFAAVPAGSGLAFVLVQHQDPSRPSLIVELLEASTSLAVVPAVDGACLEPDRIHVTPPGATATVRDGRLALESLPPGQAAVRVADRFLESLAADFGPRAVAVILSGAGRDGTDGAAAVKRRGGLVLAQEPRTAECDAMSRSVIAAGAADQVLPPERMAEAILRHARCAPAAPAAPCEADEVEQVIALLRERAHRDFQHYKRDTLRRRIRRRAGARRVGRLADYVALLRGDEQELRELSRDMLVTVTAFFREPEAFRALERSVLVPLLAESGSPQPLRVWVPGCSTGEEVYSIAIVATEAMERAGLRRPMQIFGTDMSDDALAKARAGVYGRDIEGEVGAERLQRFFQRHTGGYQVVRSLRDLATFAPQNLIGDPPFSRLDLVSCRNLLIYLEPSIQGSVTALFHFALRPGGFLFLGPSETTGPHQDLFEPISKRWRIYRRLEGRKAAPVFPLERAAYEPPAAGAAAPGGPPAPGGAWDLVQPRLLEHLGAAAVIVDRAHRIHHLAGRTDRYLAVPSGEPQFDLLSLARPGFQPRLRAALRRALAEGRAVQTGPVTVVRNGSKLRARATVIPLPGSGGEPRTAVVLFEDVPRARDEAPTEVVPVSESELVTGLERELKETRDELQTTIEEMKAAHEEALSTNEELQSSNEELETSKEELQSLNEELATVNNQLQEKLDELEAANTDTANLLQSSDTPTFFLDAELRIRRFTAAAQRVLRLLPGDLGRPLSDLTWRFRDDELLADAAAVLGDAGPREREVAGEEGRGFLRRILPYRAPGGEVTGVVVTLSDVTRLIEAEARWRRVASALQESERFVHAVLENAPVGVQVFRADGTFDRMNAAQQRLPPLPQDPARPPLNVRTDPALGATELGAAFRAAYQGAVVELPERVLPAANGNGAAAVAVEQLLFPIRDEQGSVRAVVSFCRDVSERRIARECDAQRLESLGVLAGGVAHDFNNLLVVLLGHLTLAADELPVRHAARRHLDTALEAVDRAADLTRQMLAYSGRGTFAVRPVDLNAVVVDSLPLLRAALSKRIRLHRRLASGLRAIEADVGQIRQVVVNLVGNAAEATGERGGVVGIATHEVTIGPRGREYVSPSGEPLGVGRYVVLEVTDRGEGMDAATRARIFEPFFSTKAAGRGLGLAAVLGIVRAHRGAIAVDSAAGRGTRFRVALPAGAAGARPAPVEVRRVRVPAALPVATGTVLVIDDEPLVRQVSVGILERGGFRALQAGGGAEGVEVFRRRAKEIVAVVLDLSMPGKTPGEILAALRAIDPRVPVLLTSGYAAPSYDPTLRGIAAFIPKPSTPEEYLAILRGVLAGKGRGPRLRDRSPARRKGR
ncbi:MAG: PAS domain-containing protein [Deltaproteobacteria bacterium]|nr:PAS domain-containing protein [Deltaproteobacteria bacterium]